MDVFESVCLTNPLAILESILIRFSLIVASEYQVETLS